MKARDGFDLVIVDDEDEMRSMMADYLGRHGYCVRGAASGAALDACIGERMPDLVLLDVNMPGEDGFAIARRLRATSDISIVMLTAANDLIDRVLGLELGADDYIAKPFDLRELRARVATILRRTEKIRAPRDAAPGQAGRREERAPLIPFGRMALDPQARCLVRTDGTTEALTAMEFDLLQAFASHPHCVLSRDRLLDLAHNRTYDAFDRSIDIRIARIRRKIEPDPAKPSVIKTVHGAGYIYVPPKRPA